MPNTNILLGSCRFQPINNLPKTFFVEYRMHRTPLLISQRHDRGTFDSRQHRQHVVQLLLRDIHENILYHLRLVPPNRNEQTVAQHSLLGEMESVPMRTASDSTTVSTSFNRLLTNVLPELTISNKASYNLIPGAISPNR